MRFLGRTFLIVAGLVGIGLGAILWAYPAVAAISCPTCFGFQRLPGDDNIYVPAATDAAKRSTIETLVAASENRVRGFYGALESKPKIFVCPDEACYQRVGGGRSHGMALIDWAFFVSPRGLDPVIVSHELSHIELHHRTGAVATFRRDIPQWFDEGLAVTISDDPRYLKPVGEADRCLIRSDEPLPTTRGAWVENASSHDLYAKAACRVSTWLAAHGGAKGVIDMVDHLNAGETFDAIYHRPSA